MSQNSKAVFLSYASQDAEAARCICEALRTGGVEVWFDADGGLEHGDEWDAKIRRQIKECVLFIPIISGNTQARHEGYFRIEWDLSAERARGIASGVPFILPVVIDDTREPDALVPDRFRMVQWTRLRGGEVPPEVLQRFVKLWSHRTGALRDEANENDIGRGLRTPPFADVTLKLAGFGDPALHKRRVFTAAALLALVGIASLGGFFALRSSPRTHDDPRRSVAPSTTAGVTAGPMTEADQLAARARNRVFESRDQLQVAIEMAHHATDLAPDSGRAWAVRARLDSLFILRGWDVSEQRRQEAQTFAKRALALDPNATDAMLALAVVLKRQGAYAEVEALMRRAVALAPDDAMARLALGDALSAQGKEAEALAVRQETFRRFPQEPLAHYDLALSYEHAATPDFDAALREFDASIALQPYATAVLHKVSLLAGWKGDLPGASRLLDGLDPLERTGDRAVGIAMIIGLLEHQPARTIEAGGRTARTYLEDDYVRGPKAWSLAHAYAMEGKPSLATAEWRNAVAMLRERLRATPDDWYDQAGLGVTLAWLGERDEAARLLSPLESVARESPQSLRTRYLAYYHAGLGDAPGAVQWLQQIVNRQELVTSKTLPLDPWWDKVRAAPEFQALLTPAGNSASNVPSGKSAPDPGEVPLTNSIVVLPFVNLSGDPGQEYFSDGLTEEILNALARERDLRVVPRTSAFSFKGKNLPLPEIARALNVAQVVEGSVQRAGNMVRIDCTLTRVSDGFAQPLPQFQREMKDASGIFALEDDVARAVVQKLTQRDTMTATGGGTSNWEAYDRFLRARALQFSHATGPSGYEAMHEYEAIVRLDPTFGLAWAQLAEVAAGLGTTDGGFDMSEATRARAVEAANQAVRLAPNLADAHVARAVVCLVIEQDTAAATQELHEADRLQPFNAGLARERAIMAAPTASPAALLELVTRAVDLDPQNTNTLTAMGQLLWRKGDFAHADEFLCRATVVGESQNAFLTRGVNWAAWTGDTHQALAIVNACPERFRNELFYRVLAPLYEEEGNEAGAVATWEKAREMAEKEIQTPGIRSAHALILTELGRHAAREGNPARAKAYFDQARQELDALLREQPHTFNLLVRRVQWLAAQGRFSEALAALEKIVPSAPGPEFHAPGNLTGLSGGVAAETKAKLLAAAGKTGPAIDQLEQMQAGGRAFGYALRLTPEFKSLRGVPAFESLMREAEASADAMPHPKV